MDGDNGGVTFAISILTRAVTLDVGNRHTESLICYQEGIRMLLDALKNFKGEDAKRKKLRDKVEEYMGRAEKLKTLIEDLKTTGKYREQIQVEDGAVGYSYHSVLSRFLEPSVRAVSLDDPYIRSPHQCDNFLRFVELCVKLCPNLRLIQLTTGKDPKQYDQQEARLRTIGRSLIEMKGRSIQLRLNYSDSLHDREIRLDNGWVIKIGRGLDYFKPADRLTIGFSDFDLRPCKETTIDIFHKKELVVCH